MAPIVGTLGLDDTNLLAADFGGGHPGIGLDLDQAEVAAAEGLDEFSAELTPASSR